MYFLHAISCSKHTVVYLSFTQDEYSVDEDDGVVLVCLELSEAPEVTQTPIWALIFGTVNFHKL